MLYRNSLRGLPAAVSQVLVLKLQAPCGRLTFLKLVYHLDLKAALLTRAPFLLPGAPGLALYTGAEVLTEAQAYLGREKKTDTMLGGPNALSLVPPASIFFPASVVPGVLMPTPQEPFPHRRVVDLTGGVRVERLLVAVTTATPTVASSIADALGWGSQQSPGRTLFFPPLLPTPPALYPGLPHCYQYRWHC